MLLDLGVLDGGKQNPWKKGQVSRGIDSARDRKPGGIRGEKEIDERRQYPKGGGGSMGERGMARSL